MTLIIFTFFQTVIDCDPFIKHKTFTFPERFLLRYFFQVFQDTTFKMVNLFEALLFQVGSRFFAANTAGAEHGDFFVFLGIQMLFYIFWKLTKALCLWIHSIFKGADLYFIIIARVDQQDLWVANQLIPLCRFDVGTNGMSGIISFYTHGNDFTL